jgi:phosphoketolase
MAGTLDTAVEQINKIQQEARIQGNFARPRRPMIVLNSPKGWTGPKMVDGLQVEGTLTKVTIGPENIHGTIKGQGKTADLQGIDVFEFLAELGL